MKFEKSTLEQLSRWYKIPLKGTDRKFIELGEYYIIDNNDIDENTLLVSDGDSYIKIQDNNKAFAVLRTLYDDTITRQPSIF